MCRVFNKKWSRWQNLRSRRRDTWKTSAVRRELLGGPVACSPGTFWKFGSLRMHFPHSGAWIRLFKQNTDIINFGLFLFNGTQKHACNLFKSRELYVTSRARENIQTHALCCFRTQNPGCSATERSIEEIDGHRAEITEISGNILFFFFWKKTSPIQGECFSWY